MRRCYAERMTTRTRRSARIRVFRDALSGTPRVTVVREMCGRKSERNVGPRGWLSLDEAAALLARRRGAIHSEWIPARQA